jgi:Flp pilus assembly protein TadB
MLIIIAIVAFAVLLYFNNSVRNRRIDRSNRLAEKQEELIQKLKEKTAKEQEAKQDKSDT